MQRQIALDTETTGLNPDEGHRIIEIGAVEIVANQLTGRIFHTYLNPHRSVPAEAIAIHGITAEFLSDKPSFSDVWEELIQFIDGAELLIYNAPFDLGFLNQELRHLGFLDLRIETYCTGVVDVLAESRRTGNPAHGNKLEDFAGRWAVEIPSGKHGALRDARLLADAYLAYLARYPVAVQDVATTAQTANPNSSVDLLPYLPSYALGVYRLDDELFGFKSSKDRVREFGERKINSLPVPLREFVTRLYDEQPGTGTTWDIPYIEDIPTPDNLQQTYRDFFRGQPYFDNWNTDTDQNTAGAKNFLEIKFVKNVLARILKDNALNPHFGSVSPQHQIGGYLVDFLIKGEKDYIIEVDGFEKLNSPEAFASFLHRQNVLLDRGYSIFRFGYAQIVKNWEQAARTLVRAFSKDRVLRLQLRQVPRSILLGSQAEAKICPSDLVDLFYGIQDYFALAILSKCGDSEISLRDCLGLPFPWVAMAMSSLYQWLDGIRGLYTTQLTLPDVKVITGTRLPVGVPELHPAISLQSVADVTGHYHEIGIADVWNHLANHRQPPRKLPKLQYRRAFRDAPLHEVRDAIVPFARNVFGYSDVRPDQDKVFQRVLSGLPTLALMPTGSGKSFCYWLPSILRPGLSIIISPLNALMRDQLHSLQEHGINSAAVINSDIQGPAKDALYIDAKAGRLRMLFISPERMRIRDFREELAQILAYVPVNYLVVDEAHCVSEWGHDFRPAYLGIKEFSGRLREQNPDLSLIALTATAGKNVKEDMMRVLDLCEEDVVSSKQFDRANLSYQVIKVSGYKEKEDAYRRALTHDLPASIAVSSFEEVLAPGEGAKGVGLTFVIYADPHGKHSWQDGVSHYLQLTREVLFGDAAAGIPKDAYDIGAIRGYSSKQPTFCPNCQSHRYGRTGRDTATDDEVDSADDLDAENDNDNGQFPYFCRECRSHFSSPGKPGNWDAVRHENQRAFKRGELDILVSTKGFGMGIDKGSVRFAVHTHMPSGTEGWYQEIGRAGRDRLHSHCVSIFDIPTAACIHALEEDDLRRPSCTTMHGCNKGRNDDWLCDYGKQHAFISASYPGHAQDVVRALRVMGDLLAGRVEWSGIVSLRRGGDRAQKAAELALYRLQCIGLVNAYDIKYEGGGVKFDVIGFSPEEWPDKVQDALAGYWKRHGVRNVLEETIHTVAVEACHSYSSRSRPDAVTQYEQHKPLFSKVARALAEILDHVYGDILKMRYRMLFNLYEIASSDACLRKGLMTYFHPDPGELDLAYRCEFCSNCRPDLKFRRTKAVDAVYRDDTRDAAEKLEVLLETGFIEDLDAVFTLAKDLDDSRQHAYGRASRFLEEAPRNLAALFMAMRFSPIELKATAAKDFFRIALISPSVDQSFLMRCYESLPKESKHYILEILNEVGGKLDNMSGWRWLRQEATKMSGTQPAFARISTALGIRLLTAKLAGLKLEMNVRKLNQLAGRI